MINRAEDVFMQVGEYELPQIRIDPTKPAVSEIKLHEKFRSLVDDNLDPDPRKKRYMEYDFAILTLKNELKFNDKIQPVCLPHTEKDMFVNRIAITSGWGETEAGGQSNTLKEARMKVMSNDDCTAVIKRVSKEKEEFLGLPENKKEIKITEYEIIKFAKLPYKMRLTRIRQNKTIK